MVAQLPAPMTTPAPMNIRLKRVAGGKRRRCVDLVMATMEDGNAGEKLRAECDKSTDGYRLESF
jgi:hypothetical protein